MYTGESCSQLTVHGNVYIEGARVWNETVWAFEQRNIVVADDQKEPADA